MHLLESYDSEMRDAQVDGSLYLPDMGVVTI